MPLFIFIHAEISSLFQISVMRNPSTVGLRRTFGNISVNRFSPPSKKRQFPSPQLPALRAKVPALAHGKRQGFLLLHFRPLGSLDRLANCRSHPLRTPGHTAPARRVLPLRVRGVRPVIGSGSYAAHSYDSLSLAFCYVIVIRTSSRQNCRTVNNSMVIQNGELDKHTRKAAAFYFPCRKKFFSFF